MHSHWKLFHLFIFYTARETRLLQVPLSKLTIALNVLICGFLSESFEAAVNRRDSGVAFESHLHLDYLAPLHPKNIPNKRDSSYPQSLSSGPWPWCCRPNRLKEENGSTSDPCPYVIVHPPKSPLTLILPPANFTNQCDSFTQPWQANFIPCPIKSIKLPDRFVGKKRDLILIAVYKVAWCGGGYDDDKGPGL